MTTALPLATGPLDCWNRIGIGGDRTCPELEEHVHCRSCPVFASAARGFFDRPAPAGYMAEWTRFLAEEKQTIETDSLTVLVFRLHGEWLALPAKALAEVTSPRATHRIPHRASEVLAGLVNVRGQLLICVSLHHLLGLEPPDQGSDSGPEPAGAWRDNPRLVVLGSKAQRWAFGTEEVRGMQHVARSALRAVPSTLSKVAHAFSRAVFAHEDCTVGLLDEERVFAALRSLGP